MKRPRPPFHAKKQKAPGLESLMRPRPEFHGREYLSANKLRNKRALITGGDSGIGRAVAVLYAREGADIAITYLKSETSDAKETQKTIQALGRRCVLLPGDLSEECFCKKAVKKTVLALNGLDILVSN